MRALSLWQPWCWAILDLPADDAKDVENRTWAPPGSAIGELVAIHAALKLDDEAWAWRFVRAASGQAPPAPDELPRGAIVGVVEVTGFVRESASRWFWGPVGWTLGRRARLAQPIPMRGLQGLWGVPDDVAAQLRAALGPQAPPLPGR